MLICILKYTCLLLGFPVLYYLKKFAQTQVRWVSDTIQPFHTVAHFSSCPQSFPASGSFFTNESALCIRLSKYWNFNFSISLSKEYSGFIFFRIDWLYLLAVQGTLTSLLPHHNSKASILWHSAFFMVQLSHPYMTTGESMALTIQTFASKVMSLLFNTLCRFVIAFLPGASVLISWLQSPSAMILESKKIKSVTVYSSSPFICHEVMRVDAMILIFWMLSFKPTFSLWSFTFIKRLFSSSLLSVIWVVIICMSAYTRLVKEK